MTKGSIQEDITIINIFAPNISTSIHKAKANKFEGEIISKAIIVETLISHSHTWIDQPCRKLAKKHKL